MEYYPSFMLWNIFSSTANQIHGCVTMFRTTIKSEIK